MYAGERDYEADYHNPGGPRRDKHYHRDYRLPKDEIRDYHGLGNNRDLESFPRDLADKYRDRYNQYVNRLERTYHSDVSEEFCDNRATDSRSYTERRKKTVRFNSEGWDTVEDDVVCGEGVDPRWTSASNVYYDDHRCPPSTVGGLSPVGGRDPLPGGRRVPPHWAVRELPLPVVRKELWEVERQESQDSQTKDSGIDSGTSSNFNSSEDSSKGEVPRVYRVCISFSLCPLFCRSM